MIFLSIELCLLVRVLLVKVEQRQDKGSSINYVVSKSVIFDPLPPLCVEIGLTRTLPSNQDVTVKLMSELIFFIKF